MKKYFIAILMFLTPNLILRQLLKLLRIKVGKNFKIGFSILISNKISITDDVTIGHFNFINIDNIQMMDKCYIRFFNIINGPFDLIMRRQAAIGKFNNITRAKKPITSGYSKLDLGIIVKINSFHFLDLTKSIIVGDYSTFAGLRTQVWTHGYVHDYEGISRYRIDGEVNIGNNVYVGAGSIINSGVTICDSVILGAGSFVSKNIDSKGLYTPVNPKKILSNYFDIKDTLIKTKNPVEDVYERLSQ